MNATTPAASAATLSPNGAAWLAARELDPEVAVRLGVCTIPPQAGRAGGELIAFPYLRDGKVVNHKYRLYEIGGTLPDEHFKRDKKKAAAEHGNVH